MKDLSFDNRIKKQINFILELDKEKNVLRQTHLSGYGRREDDAEHAWHMAIMAYLLKEYSNQEIDIARTMIMCLLHDVVEIDAGDTYAYDEEGLKTQLEREEAAANRIFSMLPEDQAQEIRDIYEEFQAYETPEAKFARAMDNFQPLLLNDSNNGHDWEEHKVTRAQVDNRQNGTIKGSEYIYKVTKAILDKNERQGHFLVDKEKCEMPVKDEENKDGNYQKKEDISKKRMLAVVFPGVGYHVDKPLLYYSRKLIQALGYEVINIEYDSFPPNIKGDVYKMKKAFFTALSNTEEQLKNIDFYGFEKVVFISKSIGTIVASEYDRMHSVGAKHIYYTPVAQTFNSISDKSIVFHGTSDNWVDTSIVKDGCENKNIPLIVIENANHSLETGEVMTDTQNMAMIMKATKDFLEK